MSEFISTVDALESGSYVDQKTISEEIYTITSRLRTEMDKGLTPEEMTQARAAKQACDAAAEILSRIF